MYQNSTEQIRQLVSFKIAKKIVIFFNSQKALKMPLSGKIVFLQSVVTEISGFAAQITAALSNGATTPATPSSAPPPAPTEPNRMKPTIL